MSVAFAIFRVCLIFALMWFATTSDSAAFRTGLFVVWVFIEMVFLGGLQESTENMERKRKRRRKQERK
jgi:O-antigen/teichoic acid export membrane protein